jgi:hypothetical protein
MNEHQFTSSPENLKFFVTIYMHRKLNCIPLIMLFLIKIDLIGVVDFEKEIWPILEDRCIECHKAPYEQNGRRKDPKAGLRLDGANHIMAGSDDGVIVVVDHPSQSSLYQRVILSSTDDDIMPPKGDPLSFAEKEAIRKWIAQGVDFGKWIGAVDGVRESVVIGGKFSNHALPDYLDFFDRLAVGLSPVPTSEISKLGIPSSLLVRPIGIGNSLLEVRVVTDSDQISDKTIKELGSLQDHIALLDLRSSHVTDNSSSVISSFKKITRLNLRSTKIGDSGLKQFLNLQNLQSLNLSETKVTDQGIQLLVNHPSLENLYLSGSKVTRNGVIQFNKINPSVKIVF